MLKPITGIITGDYFAKTSGDKVVIRNGKDKKELTATLKYITPTAVLKQIY
jgi:hypothetical protein